MEIIKRTPKISNKEILNTWYSGNKMQVSFNNFGHIALRFFRSQKGNNPIICKNCGFEIDKLDDGTWYHRSTHTKLTNRNCRSMFDTPPENIEFGLIAEPKEDYMEVETLIVLDNGESVDLINFIQNHVRI